MNQINKIRFEKPDLQALTHNYVVVDLHFHSTYSDGINTVPEIVDLARRMHIGVSVTDHNCIGGAVEIDQYEDLLSIPGIELTTVEGTHLLVYFYDVASLEKFYIDDVEPYMGNGVMSSLSLRMEEIIDRAKVHRSVIIFPHPYCAAYTGVCNLQFPMERLEKLYSLVDGVEVINSGNINKWNLKCAVLGFNLNKSITGGSDGHNINQMGRAVTYADCANDRESFLNAVIQRDTKVIGKEIALLRKFTSNSRKLRANAYNYPELFEKNIRYSCAVLNSKRKSIKRNVQARLNSRRDRILARSRTGC
ncbi:MAG: hypothetical protein HKM93_19950 [Desulfobacteraceae bacterium]|nr:hypothetical protein [Desulfobacteraceae bacterium]